MENKYVRFLFFLISNFGALAIGVWLMDNGPRTEWYTELNQAPWTPESWVFGVAWSTIMLCFSFYMTKLSFKFDFLHKKLVVLYGIQWVLNVVWNYVFFNQHLTEIGLVILVLLLGLIGYFTIKFFKDLKGYSILIFPYLIWLAIATSLNAFIVFYN